MKFGNPEPPIVPSASVLGVRKDEYISSTRLHPDPREALEIMKNTTWNRSIDNIGFNPFSVHFWIAHQIRLHFYNSLREISSVSMDASRDLISAILNFLNEWVRSGVPHPKEFTCDGAKAIIIDSIKAFTQYCIIRECNACEKDYLPRSYVRMDLAHFMKLCLDFVAKETNTKKVRIFYKVSLGQVVLCQDMQKAKKILKAISILAFSETDGSLIKCSEDMQRDKQRQFLENLIDPSDQVVEAMSLFSKKRWIRFQIDLTTCGRNGLKPYKQKLRK